ncbi:MAG: hypothetical protein Q8L21_00150, partial [Candidatus Komeilibacteria bacterium]|nr:hypothetical protein [Candidatus Komeilibacteria bacterium]
MEPTHGSETKRHQFIVTVGGLEGGRVYFEMNRDSAPENTKAGDTLELCVTNTGQEETESRALVLAETTVGFEVSIMRSGVLAKVQVGDELAVVITSIRP